MSTPILNNSLQAVLISVSKTAAISHSPLVTARWRHSVTSITRILGVPKRQSMQATGTATASWAQMGGNALLKRFLCSDPKGFRIS
jgi:hypothetical protein